MSFYTLTGTNKCFQLQQIDGWTGKHFFSVSCLVSYVSHGRCLQQVLIFKFWLCYHHDGRVSGIRGADCCPYGLHHHSSSLSPTPSWIMKQGCLRHTDQHPMVCRFHRNIIWCILVKIQIKSDCLHAYLLRFCSLQLFACLYVHGGGDCGMHTTQRKNAGKSCGGGWQGISIGVLKHRFGQVDRFMTV